MSVTPSAVVTVSELPTQISASRDVLHRFRKNRLAVVGMLIIGLLLFAATFAPLITSYPWDSRGPKVRLDNGDLISIPGDLHPCINCVGETLLNNGKVITHKFHAHHWFGTDDNGKDVFTRVVYGTRISLAIGFIAAFCSSIIGIIVGGIAGFYGKWLDGLLMRATDIFLAIPYILLVISIASVLNNPQKPNPGRSEIVVIVVLVALGWMQVASIFRSEVIAIKGSEYIQAARAIGASDLRIMLRHILPNAIQPVVVITTIGVGEAILSETVLSFLGVGIQPPKPSWGLMVADGRTALSTAPNVLLFPALAIFVTVIAFSFIGDGLRDALDPRLR